MKIRNKYILQPTQKSFIDSCPLGEKLIKKMGWEDGKSLGVDNTGIKECIKLKYQIETKGLGYKDNDNSKLAVLNTDFDDLLSSLNREFSLPSNETSSSPLKSKKTKFMKNKHRYIKQKKNKDISNYSLEDMKGITGNIEKDK